MKKYYCFAGTHVEVDIPDQWMYTEERALAPFRVETAEDPWIFRFEMVKELTPPDGRCMVNTGGMQVFADGTRYIGSVLQSWEGAYIRVASREKMSHVQVAESKFQKTIGAKTVLNCMMVEHLTAQNHGFVFHSSYIQRNGRGVVFTAPSGTGKSTQADLWHQLRGARILNGDRCVVRCTEEGVYACGIPFAGSSEYCENATLPLDAIVYLQQAPETTIRRLRGAEAFRRVWEGCSVNTWDRDDVEKVSTTVERVLQTVPVYVLACTPDESAITALEGVLTP